MHKLFTQTQTYIRAHKKISFTITLVVVAASVYTYQSVTNSGDETRYVTATAAKETIMTTVSGTGQVTTSDQRVVKTKVSGDIISVTVQAGDHVSVGQVLARVDATDAMKAVRDAQTNLESAKLNREDTLAPLDELSLIQLENTLARAKTSKQSAEDTLAKSYDDGFNDISNAFLDLPGIVSGLHDLLYNTSNQLGGNNVNNIDFYGSSASIYDGRGKTYRDDAATKYATALAQYNANFADFKQLDRTASTGDIEAMLKKTYQTTLAISDAVKSANNLIQFYQDQMTQHSQNIPTLSDTHLSTLNTYTGTANGNLTTLLSIQNTIKSNKITIDQATQTITEAELNLRDKKAGADALEIRSLDLTVQQKADALTDAQVALADYTIRAPFSGIIASVAAKKGDEGGVGTEIATIITNERLIELSLNEVDAEAVKVGNKVTITFDAIEELTLTGKVAAVDTLGTVSSGVVSYTVDISFDTQDERVKPGMSANATIVTNVKTDALVVPSAAVKTQNGSPYVLVFDTPIERSTGNQGTASAVAPTQKTVEIGLVGDTTTEILSGISEGTQVVTKTITGGTTSTTKTTTTSSSNKQSTSAASLLQGGAGGPPGA